MFLFFLLSLEWEFLPPGSAPCSADTVVWFNRVLSPHGKAMRNNDFHLFAVYFHVVGSCIFYFHLIF